ncbi:MAG: polymer-forming cytoskeletal protein [Nitrospinae bacterium]|nr:polymer-forming cytoskeletal protein [Nitrospinota bacterium]
MGESYKEINTFLSEGTSFEGKMKFSGIIRIDGNFNGEIKSEDTLIIGENAHIKARVEVGHTIIYGKVEGDIFSENKIEMKKSAQVFGSIHTHALDIENGALFEGNCIMLEKKQIHRADNNSTRKETLDLDTISNSKEKSDNVINFDQIKDKVKKIS